MADLIKCLRCSFRGAQTDFPRKPNLQYLKTCATCNTKQNESAGKKRATKENENLSKKKRRGLGRDKTPGGPPTFAWSVFNQLLTENKDSAFEFHAFVMLEMMPLQRPSSLSNLAMALPHILQRQPEMKQL
ncbi:hypothetical protein L208DRAFT_1408453 [Tricholoma matsutake]|nr:hypothetical protein L208DRAFT_1408453 [Tricholoma matsutake 945]